ncbi:type II CAAX endopeptidase family protein [Actinomyces sp. ZJ308]|uniref:CPBP family intramembrane glutamic endopeptidase n=1 Tax=Actinomyces sp. ZJ308 TaxID=2708342 RepID=UPI0014239848|nr:type II CAAX endopeptidase family protein [Actinomyces sp. ZJ308]
MSTSLPPKTPVASAAPAPAPSESAPGSPQSTSSRPDRLSTVALVVFTGLYVAFFPLNLGRYLIPASAAPATTIWLYIALFAVGCVALRHPLTRAARQIAARKRRAVLTLIVGGIAALAIEIVGALASSALLDLTGLSGATLQNDSNVGSAMQMFPPIVIVVVLGILGPVVEEMVFRQLLIGLIGRFAPTWVAVVVSSILFGALHMNSPALSEVLGVLPHAFFGLGMGLLYVRTDRNLLYPASIHSLNNLSAFLPLLLR